MDQFLGGLLNSKRFWIALIVLVVYLAGMQFPVVSGHSDQFVSLLAAVLLSVVGGYTLEQTAAALKSKPQTAEQAVTEVLSAIIEAIRPVASIDATPVQPNAPGNPVPADQTPTFAK